MTKRLQVGIIGLGRRWQTGFQPALATLPDQFEIAAVYDPIPRRTAVEAARLGCQAAAGVSELIQREDVEAILLLDLGWLRLWPIEQAARANKPVFCLPDLADDEAHAEALARAVASSRLPVMMAVATAVTPAALRLAERREEWLGQVRLGLCDLGQRQGAVPGSGLLSWLLSLMGAEPEAITAAGNPDAGLQSLVLDLAGGKALQITTWCPTGPDSGLRLHLIGEEGEATLAEPRRLHRRGPDGTQNWSLPRGGRREEMLLVRFHAVVCEGVMPMPSLADAFRALPCCRAAAQSRAEGRRVMLQSTASRDSAGS